ncbi:MAG: hypothetical protein ACRDZQ_11655 [Acidimicrobiales bacterium]
MDVIGWDPDRLAAELGLAKAQVAGGVVELCEADLMRCWPGSHTPSVAELLAHPPNVVVLIDPYRSRLRAMLA